MKKLMLLVLACSHVRAMEHEKESDELIFHNVQKFTLCDRVLIEKDLEKENDDYPYYKTREFKLFSGLPVEMKAYILAFVPRQIANLSLVHSEFRDLVRSDVFLNVLAKTLIATDLVTALFLYKYIGKHPRIVFEDILYNSFVSTVNELEEKEAIDFIVEMVKLNLQATLRIFCTAAASGHIGLIRTFLALKTDCETNPYNELNAILRKEPNLKKPLLLARAFFYHAGISMKSSPYCQQAEDVSGKIRTALPLEEAASHGHVYIVLLLLQNGAEVNFYETNKRRFSTILINTAQRGDKEMVQLFLDHGAKVDCVDSNGSTALILSACERHVHVVELLLEAGADQFIKNCYGKTAEILAAENGYSEIADILRESAQNNKPARNFFYDFLTDFVEKSFDITDNMFG